MARYHDDPNAAGASMPDLQDYYDNGIPVSAGSEPSAGGGPGGDTLFETSVLGLPLLVSALILPHLCPGDFIPLCLSFNPPPGRSVIVVLN